MPIHKMSLENGVFVSKQVGYIDSVDVKMWANAFKKYASTSDVPIVAMVDMTDVDRLCPTVIKTLSTVLTMPNVLGIVFVTGDQMASRNASVVGKLGMLEDVRVFSNMEDASRFVKNQTHPTFGMFNSQSVMVLRVAV